jgi:hypothetical protein
MNNDNELIILGECQNVVKSINVSEHYMYCKIVIY